MRAPSGAGLPSLATMLADIPATPSKIAHFLGLSPRTLQRYIDAGDAPRAVLLALFWETRWGRSLADTEAANWAALHFRRAEIADRQVVALRRQVEQLERELAAGGGAANSPVWMAA